MTQATALSIKRLFKTITNTALGLAIYCEWEKAKDSINKEPLLPMRQYLSKKMLNSQKIGRSMQLILLLRNILQVLLAAKEP